MSSFKNLYIIIFKKINNKLGTKSLAKHIFDPRYTYKKARLLKDSCVKGTLIEIKSEPEREHDAVISKAKCAIHNILVDKNGSKPKMVLKKKMQFDFVPFLDNPFMWLKGLYKNVYIANSNERLDIKYKTLAPLCNLSSISNKSKFYTVTHKTRRSLFFSKSDTPDKEKSFSPPRPSTSTDSPSVRNINVVTKNIGSFMPLQRNMTRKDIKKQQINAKLKTIECNDNKPNSIGCFQTLKTYPNEINHLLASKTKNAMPITVLHVNVDDFKNQINEPESSRDQIAPKILSLNGDDKLNVTMLLEPDDSQNKKSSFLTSQRKSDCIEHIIKNYKVNLFSTFGECAFSTYNNNPEDKKKPAKKIAKSDSNKDAKKDPKKDSKKDEPTKSVNTADTIQKQQEQQFDKTISSSTSAQQKATTNDMKIGGVQTPRQQQQQQQQQQALGASAVPQAQAQQFDSSTIPQQYWQTPMQADQMYYYWPNQVYTGAMVGQNYAQHYASPSSPQYGLPQQQPQQPQQHQHQQQLLQRQQQQQQLQQLQRQLQQQLLQQQMQQQQLQQQQQQQQQQHPQQQQQQHQQQHHHNHHNHHHHPVSNTKTKTPTMQASSSNKTSAKLYCDHQSNRVTNLMLGNSQLPNSNSNISSKRKSSVKRKITATLMQVLNGSRNENSPKMPENVIKQQACHAFIVAKQMQQKSVQPRAACVTKQMTPIAQASFMHSSTVVKQEMPTKTSNGGSGGKQKNLVVTSQIQIPAHEFSTKSSSTKPLILAASFLPFNTMSLSNAFKSPQDQGKTPAVCEISQSQSIEQKEPLLQKDSQVMLFSQKNTDTPNVNKNTNSNLNLDINLNSNSNPNPNLNQNANSRATASWQQSYNPMYNQQPMQRNASQETQWPNSGGPQQTNEGMNNTEMPQQITDSEYMDMAQQVSDYMATTVVQKSRWRMEQEQRDQMQVDTCEQPTSERVTPNSGQTENPNANRPSGFPQQNSNQAGYQSGNTSKQPTYTPPGNNNPQSLYSPETSKQPVYSPGNTYQTFQRILFPQHNPYQPLYPQTSQPEPIFPSTFHPEPVYPHAIQPMIEPQNSKNIVAYYIARPKNYSQAYQHEPEPEPDMYVQTENQFEDSYQPTNDGVFATAVQDYWMKQNSHVFNVSKTNQGETGSQYEFFTSLGIKETPVPNVVKAEKSTKTKVMPANSIERKIVPKPVLNILTKPTKSVLTFKVATKLENRNALPKIDTSLITQQKSPWQPSEFNANLLNSKKSKEANICKAENVLTMKHQVKENWQEHNKSHKICTNVASLKQDNLAKINNILTGVASKEENLANINKVLTEKPVKIDVDNWQELVSVAKRNIAKKDSIIRLQIKQLVNCAKTKMQPNTLAKIVTKCALIEKTLEAPAPKNITENNCAKPEVSVEPSLSLSSVSSTPTLTCTPAPAPASASTTTTTTPQTTTTTPTDPILNQQQLTFNVDSAKWYEQQLQLQLQLQQQQQQQQQLQLYHHHQQQQQQQQQQQLQQDEVNNQQTVQQFSPPDWQNCCYTNATACLLENYYDTTDKLQFAASQEYSLPIYNVSSTQENYYNNPQMNESAWQQTSNYQYNNIASDPIVQKKIASPETNLFNMLDSKTDLYRVKEVVNSKTPEIVNLTGINYAPKYKNGLIDKVEKHYLCWKEHYFEKSNTMQSSKNIGIVKQFEETLEKIKNINNITDHSKTLTIPMNLKGLLDENKEQKISDKNIILETNQMLNQPVLKVAGKIEPSKTVVRDDLKSDDMALLSKIDTLVNVKPKINSENAMIKNNDSILLSKLIKDFPIVSKRKLHILNFENIDLDEICKQSSLLLNCRIILDGTELNDTNTTLSAKVYDYDENRVSPVLTPTQKRKS